MKKLFFALVLFYRSFYLYPAPQTQIYPEINIKVENMTNAKIKFYFNQLYDHIALEYMGSWETLRTPVMENDGYFAIEYSSGAFELYTFYEHMHERGITRKDLYYTVMVSEEGATVSPGKTAHDIVGDYEGFYWMKETWDSMQSFWNTGKMIELVLKNNSNENISVFVMDTHYYNDDRGKNYGSKPFTIRPHSEGNYQFPVRMISLHKRVRITYNFWHYKQTYPIYLDFSQQIIPDKIQVIFNEFGYEIQFNN